MKLAHVLIALPLALATTAPVIAQPVTGGQTSATPAANERRVCRATQRTGSNIRARRVCLTESQWRARDQLDRERVNELAERVNGACRTPSDGSSCIGN